MSDEGRPVSEVVGTLTRCRIERTVRRDFRGTRTAHFATPSGYFLCEVWFEQAMPQFQFRSNAVPVDEHSNPLETAAIVATAIHMAIAWAAEEMEATTT